MTSDSFQLLSRLLDEALERPPEEREEYLRRASGGDERILAAALAALAADDVPMTHLRGEIAEALGERRDPGQAPEGERRCGPFRLLRQIGTGGMGEVFLAERVDADFAQRVAVKVLPQEVRSLELRRRLERERQILARLEHPGIARLVDGGIAADGTPYLALEYVDGLSLPEFLAEKRPDLQEKMRIFLELCDAVAFVHQRLVIHRDLKPTNVMIGSDGRARLLDFGIAGLLEEDDLGLTRTVDHLLTPRYAAPEQVRGEPSTTSTDIHGLGLLLFELLAGERAFGADATTATAVAREILEREAPRPTSVSRELRARREGGDFDAITAKAMRKRPEERYAAVTDLAADVRRALGGLPVSARGGDRLYRASRFLLRHRFSLATAAAVFVALSVGLLLAVRERDRAQASEAKAVAIQRFLVDDLLLAATPEESRGRALTVREVLDSADERVERALGGEPDVERSVRGVLADVYLRLGEIDAADRQIAREAKLMEAAGPEDRFPGEVRKARLALARQEYPRALTLASGLLDESLASGDPATGRAVALLLRGRAEEGLGQYARAEASYRSARLASLGPARDERVELEILSRLVTIFTTERRDLEAESAARELLERSVAVHGEAHPARVLALSRLALALRRLQRPLEAEEAARRGIELARRLLPEGHELEFEATRVRVLSLVDLRHFDDARRESEGLLARSRAARGSGSVAAASAEELRAILHAYDREYAEAAALYRHALPILQAGLGELHSTTLRVRRNLIGLFRRQGDESAQRAGSAALVQLARDHQSSRGLDPTTLRDLALLALRAEPADLRDPAVGLQLARSAVERTERRWLDALVTLAEALESSGDLPSAIATMREAYASPDALLDSSMVRMMVRLLKKLDDPSSAGEIDAFLAGTAARRRALYPTDFALESDTLSHLAARDQELGRHADAVAKLEAADAALAPHYSETHEDRVTTVLALVENLRSLGRADEARARLQHFKERLDREPDADPDLREEVDAALAELGGAS